MALVARLAERQDSMVGIRRPRVVTLVTLGAVLIGQLVIAVRVAVDAGDAYVMSCQRECGRRMIERCRGPACCGMALLARLAE